jgi:hypothetical protein
MSRRNKYRYETGKASRSFYVDADKADFIRDFYDRLGYSMSRSVDVWITMMYDVLTDMYDSGWEYTREELFKIYIKAIQEITDKYQKKIDKGLDRFEQI